MNKLEVEYKPQTQETLAQYASLKYHHPHIDSRTRIPLFINDASESHKFKE